MRSRVVYLQYSKGKAYPVIMEDKCPRTLNQIRDLSACQHTIFQSVAELEETLEHAVHQLKNAPESVQMLGGFPGDKGLRDTVIDLLARVAQENVLSQDILEICVDYSISAASMIHAGKFARVAEPIIEGAVSVTGEGIVRTELVIVQFRSDVLGYTVTSELTRMNLELARLEHACALAAQYPDLLCEYEIVFYGSGHDKGYEKDYVVLTGSDKGRFLSLGGRPMPYTCWPSSIRFAGIRKPL